MKNKGAIRSLDARDVRMISTSEKKVFGSKGQIFAAAAVIVVVALISIVGIFTIKDIQILDYSFDHRVNNVFREYEVTTAISSTRGDLDGKLLDNLSMYMRSELYPMDIRIIYFMVSVDTNTNGLRVVVGNYLKDTVNISLLLSNTTSPSIVFQLSDGQKNDFVTAAGGNVMMSFNYTIGRNIYSGTRLIRTDKNYLIGLYDATISDDYQTVRKVSSYSVVG
ncbi:MAG: hypothetical protein ABIA21_01500 [Candidatus Aenigmatarchaeota archaeon]